MKHSSFLDMSPNPLLGTVKVIHGSELAVAFLPVVVVVLILSRWSLGSRFAVYALARMLLQLLAIGYVLTYVFRADQSWIVLAVLTTMLVAASWISLRPLLDDRPRLYVRALISIVAGGATTLMLVTQLVLRIEPWFDPSKIVPLAGMIFASSMNTISIAAERFQAERQRGLSYHEARNTAMSAALIPLFNSLLAVGLVSLPGMMTGQILSGIDPLIAARYQIVVMCMIFGSSGISSACFLTLLQKFDVTMEEETN